MARRLLPLPQVYAVLEPGPVVLLTTAHRGRANVMTMSWHTMLEFEPPLVGCVVSENDFSFTALRRTREAAINVPTVALAAAVVGSGNRSGREIDKFAAFGLVTQPASRIAPPLIAGCHAQLECRVVDTTLVRRYGLFVLEVVAAWIDRSLEPPRTLHHRGRGRFMVAGDTIRLPSRAR